MQEFFVYFEDQLARAGRWRRRYYKNPIATITANEPEDVPAALDALQDYQSRGFYLAGYFSYELGYLFEDRLAPLIPGERTRPLLQFGAFETFETSSLPMAGKARIGKLVPAWTKKQYLDRYEKVQAYIRAGDVYQINLTFPLRGTYQGDAVGIYQFLKDRQPVSYGGVVNLGHDPVVTLSPELFFERNGSLIEMRPMKGTIKRGASDAEDQELRELLHFDSKNRAENLMIVDLLRNDLSRLCKPGSVNVKELFTIETYPSLHTMTSSIEATLNDGISVRQLLRSLFPCGSVTGAPKIRAMEIINELETVPRGVYCGALGMIDPDGRARFNVGIRTLSLSDNGRLSYAVGSGVVSDSDGGLEYDECLLKAAFLTDGEFQLIETMGWDHQAGFMHLDLHLHRLAGSAYAFGFAFAEHDVRAALTLAVQSLNSPHKVRLTLASNGELAVACQPLTLEAAHNSWPVTISEKRLDSRNNLLRHKTTKRSFYETEFARVSSLNGCKEVLFFNEKDELCEGSFTNIFLVKDGRMMTPSISSGLLPGILREVLLANKEIQELILTRDDLLQADEIWVGNSARGLIRAHLTGTDPL